MPNYKAIFTWLLLPVHMFIVRGTSSFMHVTFHQPLLQLGNIGGSYQITTKCVSSLEMEHICYRNNNVHVAYRIHDVPQESNNSPIDSSIVF